MRTPLTDLKRLLIRYREVGDDDAFAEFAAAARPILWAWAYSVLWDRHLAEDAVQIALWRIARAVRRRKWRSQFPIEGWARTIVIRIAIDLLRNRRREMVVSTQTKSSNGEASPHETLVSKELHDRIRAWLDLHATVEERFAFHGRLVEGMKWKDIGKRMPRQQSAAAVFKVLAKALRKLAAFLGDGEPPEKHLVEGENNG